MSEADAYTVLAACRVDLLNAASRRVSSVSLASQARALTLWDGRRVVAMDGAQEAMVYDLAVLDPVGGHTPGLLRHAKAQPPAPNTPDALMLDALLRARFGLFRLLGAHAEGGAELQPLPEGAPIRVFDRFLATNTPGMLLAARLCGPGGIAMTCGVVARLDTQALERLLDGTPPERGKVIARQPPPDDTARLEQLLARPEVPERLLALQQAPGLAARAYRMALDQGLMGEVPGR